LADWHQAYASKMLRIICKCMFFRQLRDQQDIAKFMIS
jgi:hypothetical protein